MDPVSNADRLVRLFRQRLEERAKAKRATGSAPHAPVLSRGMDHVRTVTGRLAQAGVNEEHLQRVLVEQLLADQFGPAMVNEPKFQQVVDRVFEAMRDDREIGPLLTEALGDLRSRKPQKPEV